VLAADARVKERPMRLRDSWKAELGKRSLPERLLALARRVSARARMQLRERLGKVVTVKDGNVEYAFWCASFEEYLRAAELFHKEPDTVRWLRSELREGDVFYDIGANVGSYTIPAARAVGESGCVYAFEPHAANVASLLRNLTLNGVAHRVRVLSCALHETAGFFDFNYSDLSQGSAMSQLGSVRDPFGHDIIPVASELKFSTTVDDLVERGLIKPASLVKIDVDGNELLVLRGMKELVSGDRRPRGIQVEVNVAERAELPAFLESCGFELAERHYTAAGRHELENANDPESVYFNGIFRPSAELRAAS
jgi:FkbM family methyltransferase